MTHVIHDHDDLSVKLRSKHNIETISSFESQLIRKWNVEMCAVAATKMRIDEINLRMTSLFFLRRFKRLLIKMHKNVIKQYCITAES